MRFTFPRRFSLRVLFAGMTACCLALGIVARELHLFQDQVRALSALAATDKYVAVEWEAARPNWFWRPIERISGIPCRNVVGYKSGRFATVDDAEVWRRFPKLRRISLEKGLMDEVIEKISHFATLEEVILVPYGFHNGRGESPGDDGVRHLARLPRLRFLALVSGLKKVDGNYQLMLTDESFAPVAAAGPPLERLIVLTSKITIESLRPLLKRGTLRYVTLPESFVEHVDELLAVPSLQFIEIAQLPDAVRARAPKRLGRGSVDLRMGQGFERVHRPGKN